MTKKSKKTEYISFTKAETKAMRTLGYRERNMYFELKWLSDFKTGWVGEYYRQRITYDDLAALIFVPSSQGRPAVSIDDKEASRCLQRLRDAGLVADIEQKPGGGLRFSLPQSPLNQKAADDERQKVRAQEMLKEIEEEQNGWRMPEKLANDPAGLLEIIRDSGHLPNSLSVLSVPKDNNTFFNTEISNDGARDTPAPRCQGSEPHPLLENPKDESGGWSAAEIRTMLEQNRFIWTDCKPSRLMYERWLRIGVTPEDLQFAILAVSNDDGMEQTPRAVDHLLRKQFGSQEPTSAARKKSGVQL